MNFSISCSDVVLQHSKQRMCHNLKTPNIFFKISVYSIFSFICRQQALRIVLLVCCAESFQTNQCERNPVCVMKCKLEETNLNVAVGQNNSFASLLILVSLVPRKLNLGLFLRKRPIKSHDKEALYPLQALHSHKTIACVYFDSLDVTVKTDSFIFTATFSVNCSMLWTILSGLHFLSHPHMWTKTFNVFLL